MENAKIQNTCGGMAQGKQQLKLKVIYLIGLRQLRHGDGRRKKIDFMRSADIVKKS